jgi:hypothetical protein
MYRKICSLVGLAGLLAGFAVLGLSVSASADLAPLYADQYKVVGTNDQGTTSVLYCAPASGTSAPLYCSDSFNHNPSTVTGLEYVRVATRYGWTLKGVPVAASCVPETTYANYIRSKTLRCSMEAN